MTSNPDPLSILTRPKRILLVDDDEAFRSAVSDYLILEGAESIAVSDGSEALEVFSKSDFDLVLLDIKLPGIDGVTVAKSMRQQDPYYPAIIFLTGFPSSLDAAHLASVPGPVVLTLKPIHLQDLSCLVQTYARRRSYGS